MEYTIRKMGQLFLDEKPQLVPKNPIYTGDIPNYISGAGISIRDAVTGQEPITWIRPGGMNLLVVDRCLLNKVSWNDLQIAGFVDGLSVELGGNSYLCRLLQVGTEEEVPNEWDSCLNICGRNCSLWHWESVYFGGQETASQNSLLRAVRGYYSARYWDNIDAEARLVEVGFRPALIPLDTAALPSSSETGCSICKGRSYLRFQCDIRIEASDGVVQGVPVPVNRCPVCGRKLRG